MSRLRRLFNTLYRSRLDRDIERELAFHVTERADDLRAQGMDADEALRQARLQFGNPMLQADRTRDVDIIGWFDALVRTVRYAGRATTRTPGFSAMVIITLAVGIGANTAVFSAIDAVVFRPLPVREGERLVRVMEFVETETDADTQIAPGRLEEWASRATSLSRLTGYYIEDVSDTSGTLPERVRRAVVAPRFLDVWGVAPAVGRDFIDAEYKAGGPPAVLISDRYWRTRLDADPDVLRRVVRIEGQSYSIAGVMPASFEFPDRHVDLWWPYPVDGPAMRNTAENRKHRWYTGIGRLQPGVTPAQSQADLTVVQGRLASAYPATDGRIGVRVVPYRQTLFGEARESLWLLYGSVSLLLLIACTNIASLWLSRATQRQHELAVRFALGATRASVVGQLLTETAVLTCVGATFGLLVAAGASAGILALVPALPSSGAFGLDVRMLTYTTATALVVTVLCGILPAVRGTRAAAFAGGGRTQVTGRHPVQWLLVGVQISLSVVLLLGAGLLVRSIDAVSRVDPGFDPHGVLALRMSANWGETADRDALVQRIERTLEHLAALPGVTMTATAWSLPGVPRRYQAEFELMGRASSEPTLVAEWRTVSPEYFGLVRISIAGGELCRRPATGEPTTELMVNRSFVDRYFRDRSIVGSHLRWESGSQTARVVGVVEEARELGMDRPPSPTVYACDSAPSPFPWFLVRTEGAPAFLAPTVRASLRELDPHRSVYDMSPLSDRIGDAYAQTRLRTSLLALFAVTALLLACLGVYATVSYVVSLRRREVSLRLALGARRGQVVRHLVWQSARVTLVGCACGVALALALSRSAGSLLYGVSPSDPATFAGAVAIVLVFSGLAAVVPSVRATFVQPIRVLREE